MKLRIGDLSNYFDLNADHRLVYETLRNLQHYTPFDMTRSGRCLEFDPVELIRAANCAIENNIDAKLPPNQRQLLHQIESANKGIFTIKTTVVAYSQWDADRQARTL